MVVGVVFVVLVAAAAAVAVVAVSVSVVLVGHAPTLADTMKWMEDMSKWMD